MTLIEFTLYSFDEDVLQNLDFLKQYVESHCISVNEWSIISKNHSGGNKLTKPDFREPVLKLQCLSHINIRQGFCEYLCYQEIIKSYISQSFHVSSKFQLPWLALYCNRAFPVVRTASHENVLLENMQLGTLVNPNNFNCHFEFLTISSSRGPFQVGANFFHDTKEMEVTIDTKAKFVLSYSNIRRILVSIDEQNAVSLYFCLINPPLLYVINEHNGRRPSFKRALNMPKDIRCGESAYCCLNALTTDILGRSSILRITISSFEAAQEIISRMFFRCGKFPICFTAMETRFVVAPQGIPIFNLGHFGCTYMFSALLRRNYILQMQNPDLEKTLIPLLQEFVEHSPECLYDTLVDLQQKMEEGAMMHYRTAIGILFSWYFMNTEYIRKCTQELGRQPQEIDILTSAKTRKVWRIIITPTRFLLYPADVCFENRVIRNFDPGYACRISFRDDTMRKISLAQINCEREFIDFTIRFPLLEGIRIGPRYFEFLGWSNSQLRDHAVWTYARDEQGNDARTIRAWMGNFSNIRSVPKFMARMGQCFSQTEAAVKVPLDPMYVRTESDVMGGRNPESGQPYCFSDGVGKISKKLQMDVCNALELSSCPSAFQIRYAGYKGMLVVDPSLFDVDIVFRESMNKFPCKESNFLEVAKVSSAVQVMLNRQLITILDQKGIPSATFLKLQQDMLTMLTEMLLDGQKAAEWLSIHSAITHVNFNKLAEGGVILHMEPFFRAMLLAQHRVAVEGLRTKARLYIDPSLGRNMFGVMDETTTLEYGQVFVQYTTNILGRDENVETTVLKGKVLVTKNPCLQLGDVRMFEAVDVPVLHHIVDCIVFPQKGPRPHPNEMAGSDLDGDEYTVLWMTELFFSEGNSPASTFPIPKVDFETKEIEVSDMIDFLCKYISNDQVGHIANCHLARADDIKYGLKHECCQTIARKFSVAVDFAKNGQVVNLNSDERPTMYPDFMEKGRHGNTYRSKRTLGKLYRICLDFEEENQISNVNYSSVLVDQSYIYPGWERFRENAEVLRNRYNSALGLLLSTYGIQHEAEATAKAFSKVHSRLQERQDRADVEELIMHSLNNLWRTFRKEFFGEAEPVTGILPSNFNEEQMQKASAWYIVTYIKPKPKFLSFPWIVWNILINIKQINEGKIPTTLSEKPNPLVAQLDLMIRNLLVNNVIAELTYDVAQLCEKQNVFPPETMKFAVKLVLHWAQYHKILQPRRSVPCSNQQRRMKPTRLTNLFIKVISATCSKATSPTELLLKFFRYCISFRFLNRKTAERMESNLEYLKNYKHIGKKCMYTFHSLAVGSNLLSLGLNNPNNNDEENEVEMEPVRVPREFVVEHVRANFEILRNQLIHSTGVKDVHIRAKDKFVLISGTGNQGSIRLLQDRIIKWTSTKA